MTENHDTEQGNESTSEPESLDDLFLSPDDSGAEELPLSPGESESDPSTKPAAPNPGPAVDNSMLVEMEAERDDYRNRMMRVAADLENFRKRTAREKEDMRKYGIDRVILELLPVLDNLERALDHADKSADSTTIVDGIRMVQRQFITALEKHGVRGYDAKGEHFDPQKHEAIQQIETTEHPTGFVLEEYQRGYYLHERLIRPALVVVARNPEGAPVSAVMEDASAEDGVEAAQEGAGDAPSDTSDGTDEPDESTVN